MKVLVIIILIKWSVNVRDSLNYLDIKNGHGLRIRKTESQFFYL